MKISPIVNHSYNNLSKSAFRGKWESRTVGCPYPYEGMKTIIHTYVADPDEPLSEIADNFAKRSSTRDIIGRQDHGSSGIYSVNENFFTDLSKSLEYKKMRLTKSSDEKFNKGEFVDAVKDKVEIATILKKQGKEHDKFLTEEGIRRIYSLANREARFMIEKVVNGYNPEMAADLFRHLK